MALLVVCALSRPSLAQDEYIYLQTNEAIGWVKAVHLLIDDQVEGGCWLNASAVESKTRLLFEQNGIRVYREPLAFYSFGSPMFVISANGERTDGTNLCYGSLAVRVLAHGNLIYGGSEEWPQAYSVFVTSTLFETSWIMLNGTNFDNQIDRNVEGAASDFIADIIAARRNSNVSEMLPFWTNEPMTDVEFREILQGVTSD